MITTKRIYDPPDPADGFRLLVMRRWPRGVRKTAVDAWEKDLGPSVDLLRSWQSGEISWHDCSSEYLEEVKRQPALVEWARGLARQGTLTLLCSCQDARRCHRTLLQRVLEEMP